MTDDGVVEGRMEQECEECPSCGCIFIDTKWSTYSFEHEEETLEAFVPARWCSECGQGFLDRYLSKEAMDFAIAVYLTGKELADG